jgi:hypothetical protein
MDTSARDLVEHAHALIGRGQLAQAAVVFEDVVRQFAEHKCGSRRESTPGPCNNVGTRLGAVEEPL